MAQRSRYVCQSCGHVSPRWLGRCPECESWDGLVEEKAPAGSGKQGPTSGAVRRTAEPAAVVPLVAGDEASGNDFGRLASGYEMVDRVLGGGIVPGAAVLLAGEPGIGKSTLLLQIGDRLARDGTEVLYASAEESPRQLRLRAERLGCRSPSLMVAGETELETLLATIAASRPTVVLVDSVQALRSRDLAGPPGSIGQLRHAADRLVEVAKERHVPLFLVGHVTKEGAIAGPKSLEHLVDTVLTFEGDAHGEHRILRAMKNRFGPTGEVAMFEMHDDGLQEVRDPSRVLLARRRGHYPGSAVVASMHGSRPLLVELQALVNATSFPSPRRMSLGLDSNRVTLLVAVLERFGGLALGDRDLFLNVVGGLTLREPAADLATAAAVLSAARGEALPEGAIFFGEVGLLGEVRPVSQSEARLREAAALGFERVIMPRMEKLQVPAGLEIVVVEDIAELAAAIFGAAASNTRDEGGKVKLEERRIRTTSPESS